MKKLYPKLLLLFILLSLLIPFGQRKGNPIKLYGDFWGKSDVNWIINRIRYALGDRVFETSLIDKSDWAIFLMDDSLQDYQRINTLSADDLRIIQSKLDQVTSAFQKHGIKTWVIVPPSKETIYPERVNAQLIPVIGSQSNLDLFVDYMRAHAQTPVIDLRSALREEKRSEPVYYASDTHWNPYGAYAGYRETMQAVRQTYPTIPVIPRSSLVCTQSGLWSGDMYTALGLDKKVELQIDCIPQGGWIAQKKVIDRDHLYTYNPQGSLRAIVYHDSFATALKPYFSESFREVDYLLTYSYEINSGWVYSTQPDVVLIEITERYLKYMKNFIFLQDQ